VDLEQRFKMADIDGLVLQAAALLGSSEAPVHSKPSKSHLRQQHQHSTTLASTAVKPSEHVLIMLCGNHDV
jgi:hypothetical protein